MAPANPAWITPRRTKSCSSDAPYRAATVDHALGGFHSGQMPDKRELFTKRLQCAGTDGQNSQSFTEQNPLWRCVPESGLAPRTVRGKAARMDLGGGSGRPLSLPATRAHDSA